jgi:hypothetical protein
LVFEQKGNVPVSYMLDFLSGQGNLTARSLNVDAPGCAGS